MVPFCILTKRSGVGTNIRFLYEAIIRMYNPGDFLHFLGFSRGAYTVRCLLDFIATVGIVSRNPQIQAPPAQIASEMFDIWEAHAQGQSLPQHLPYRVQSNINL